MSNLKSSNSSLYPVELECLCAYDSQAFERLKNEMSDLFSVLDKSQICLYSYLSVILNLKVIEMKNKNIPTPQDIKLFKLMHANLSKAEFNFLCNFYDHNESLSSEEKEKLLKDEYPDLYDKLLRITGKVF